MPIVIVLIVFSSLLLGLKLVLDFQRDHGERPEGSAIGTTELRRMLHEAVEEGLLPLRERLDRIEPDLRRISAGLRQLPPAPPDQADAAETDD